MGDLGRRGQLQNLPFGPTPPTPDDQFGGPEPDAAHFAGVILRLNDDGSAPADNPFFGLGGNLQKVYAYGVRNGFGMAFDPLSGNLWDQENGEDGFDEVNLIERGMNSGWIQVTGPLSRIGEFKQIETTSLHHDDFRICSSSAGGRRRSPTARSKRCRACSSYRVRTTTSRSSAGSTFWPWLRSDSSPGGDSGLSSRGTSLWDFRPWTLSVARCSGSTSPGIAGKIGVDDPRLEDRVADNLTFHDMTESESLVVGEDFGIVIDIRTGPNGNLFVVSLSNGAIYEVARWR